VGYLLRFSPTLPGNPQPQILIEREAHRMKRTIGSLILPLSLVFSLLPLTTSAQSMTSFAGARGHTVIPASSQFTAADAGVRMHTNVRIFVPDSLQSPPAELPPFSGYAYETPASLACVYGLVAPTPGCNPNSTTTNPSGGSAAIAIVDAYDDPYAASDLATYSEQFGLPPAKLTVVYASGSKPAEDPTGGWELEESLDIEIAHAMAPGAQIYLVEAKSDEDTDLYPAVQIGASLIACGKASCRHGGNGRGEVSMSWGGAEYSTEAAADPYFQYPGVVFLAASGDDPGTDYPCTSPNVVCMGGTGIARSIFTGNYLYEVAWMDAGAGFSLYEPRPSYQNSISSIVGPARGVPDVSFEASTNTGTWIYDTLGVDGEGPGWYIVYGTSTGTPSMAGIVNVAGHFHDSSAAELERIYSAASHGIGYTDLQKGYCGPYLSFAATPGWDFCTGVGSPYGYRGK
jgi:kumamolisin